MLWQLSYDEKKKTNNLRTFAPKMFPRTYIFTTTTTTTTTTTATTNYPKLLQ